MRILHLSTSDTRGGAARGGYWLHHTLRGLGIDSTMLVHRKYGDDDTVVPLIERAPRVRGRLSLVLDTLPLMLYPRKSAESYWTTGWMPNGVERMVARLDPDIVHLHWIGGGFVPVEALPRFGRPVVWTLRDMWAFTGGCHYTAGCERYRTRCGACPQLGTDSEADLSRWVWRRKARRWAGLDIRVVAISRWLAACARSSPLFSEAPIEVIPNGVQIDRFTPCDGTAAKAAWGLSPDRCSILFGAIDAVRDPRKGFGQLLAATRDLACRGWKDRAELVVFGDVAPEACGEAGLPVKFVGRISDDCKLARLYAGADVMVVPSLQEAFGKTLIEAMACGTPVVAFDTGGPADIVEHLRTGYLARSFVAEDLANGILWCAADAARQREIGMRARVAAASRFDVGVIAQRYAALYQRILEERT